MATGDNFTSIPRLDLSLASSPTTEPQLLSQLRHTLINVGFLYIENHGISPETIHQLQNALPRLFALPTEAKEEVALSKSPHFLGYSADGSETTAGKTDRREQFEFANELDETWTDEKELSERLRGPNAVCQAITSLMIRHSEQ
jgi:isopenicillin N synthase-like dioxygenase